MTNMASNPFADPDAHLTLAQVAEFEALVAGLRSRMLSPREHARLGWLNARARPPRYDILPERVA